MRVGRAKRWLIVALIPVLVVSLVYIFLPFILDKEQYRGITAAGLSSVLGRTVSLKGPITLTFTLHPRLVFEDVRITNPSWTFTISASLSKVFVAAVVRKK